MKELYQIAGLSKQAMWKYLKHKKAATHASNEIINAMNKIRKHHKRMGCRRMYYAIKEPMPVGRDLFEQIGFANGFKLKRKRNTMKTTWGQRVEVYPNLIEGKILNDINQVWQTDIFYLNIENNDYYGVSIEDVYSRKLLALHLSKSLSAQQIVIAIKKSLQVRLGSIIRGCIVHSDQGSQYISHAYKTLLKANHMQISMCKMPQENAYVERVQGTLKHEYFYEFALTEKNLQNTVRKIITYYNNERPHSQLGMMTPNEFEKHVEKIPLKQRPIT